MPRKAAQRLCDNDKRKIEDLNRKKRI